jgi:hypothetical protein
MLPPFDPSTVAPVNGAGRVGAPNAVADPSQQALARALQTLIGKTMQADVLARLNDGSFVVRVAGNAARMQLPAGVDVGGKVTLTLVGLEPRPTFQFGGGGRAAALAYTEPAAPSTFVSTSAQAGTQAAAGNAGGPALRPASYAAALLSKAPLTPADQLPPLDANSQPAVLSQAGRIISSVLSVAMQSPPPSAAVIGKLPLLPAPSPDPARLAAALHDAVGTSGLFYESHLGEWSAGARPLAALLNEPQMQGALAASRPGAAEAGITDQATAQFINQQLSVQEQGRVAWQGQLWPGQGLRWEISRDRPGRGAPQNGDGDPAAAPWRSGLRFRFPLLGEIGATVVLSGGQLHIAVEAGAGPVRDLLRAHAGALDSALAAAGSPLTSLTVRAPGQDDG